MIAIYYELKTSKRHLIKAVTLAQNAPIYVFSVEGRTRQVVNGKVADMPVGASTMFFFFVFLQIYFRKVLLPEPALPVRKTDLWVFCNRFHAH